MYEELMQLFTRNNIKISITLIAPWNKDQSVTYPDK